MKKEKAIKVDAARLYRKYGIFIILVIMFIISAVMNKNFLKPQNLLNILTQISVVTIIACGETILIISGMIDLSAGMVCTMSSCFAAGILLQTGSLTAAILAGVFTGAAAGWVNGFLITKFKLQPFIATLAMTNIAQGITQVYTGGTAIGAGEKVRFLGQGRILGIPMPVIVMLTAVIIIFLLMSKTKLGVNIYIISRNPE